MVPVSRDDFRNLVLRAMSDIHTALTSIGGPTFGNYADAITDKIFDALGPDQGADPRARRRSEAPARHAEARSMTTLAHRIAAAIRIAKDEDGFLFADMLSAEDIWIIAEVAAGVEEEHIAQTQSPQPPAQE